MDPMNLMACRVRIALATGARKIQTYPDNEDSRLSKPPVGGALANTGRVGPLRHPSHPRASGLACRPVGAWRRHLVKRLQYNGESQEVSP